MLLYYYNYIYPHIRSKNYF